MINTLVERHIGCMETINCANCGKSFNRYTSNIKKAKNNFCSIECKGQWQSINIKDKNSPCYKRISIKCDWCGKKVDKKPHKINNVKNHFCNRECHNNWKHGKNNPAWGGGKIKDYCSLCGKDILIQKSQKKRTKNLFCSIKCRNEWHGKKINAVCDYCGKEINREHSKIKKAKNIFCSSECHYKWSSINLRGKDNPCYKSVEITCDTCGMKFNREPNRIKNENNNFCSRKCFGIWTSIRQTGQNNCSWLGGISFEPYCPTWKDKEFKNYILTRDNFKCQNPDCWGTSNGLARHHINFNKKDCSPDNIITVCSSCNSRANKDREWHESYYNEIMRRKTECVI